MEASGTTETGLLGDRIQGPSLPAAWRLFLSLPRVDVG